MRLWILAIALVGLVACGGGEASTAIPPTLPSSVEKSTVASPPPAPSTTPVDEAVPAEALAQFEAGVVLQEIGHLEEAIAEYDEAIRLNSRYALAYNNRGKAYFGSGEHERAIQDMDEAIRLDPELAMAYSNRGGVYSALGHHERAVKDLDESIRLDPLLSEAYVNRGAAYFGQGQHERAIRDLDEAIRLDPGLAMAYVNRGSAYGGLGQFERAIEDYDEAIRLDLQLAMAYNNRGRIYGELGQYARAIEDFDEAIRLDPGLAMAYVNRGSAYGVLGQFERAIEDYDEAIRLDLQLAMAYNNRGRIYGGLGQYARAIEDFDEAIRLDPDFALAYANRALGYSLLGKDEEAQQDADRAVELGLDRDTLRDLTETTIAAAGGIKAAEWNAVQANIDVMMADNKMTSVTAGSTAAKITSTTDFGGGQLIASYFWDPYTTWCYTWDASGKLLSQTECSPAVAAAGEQGPKDAEWDAVQSAIDLMMADNDLAAVPAGSTAAKIRSTTDFGGGQSIATYFRYPSWFCYTWDATGKLLSQTDCSPAVGEQIFKDAEWDIVQRVIDGMMADNRLSKVTANGIAAKIISTTDFGEGQSIAIYIGAYPPLTATPGILQA